MILKSSDYSLTRLLYSLTIVIGLLVLCLGIIDTSIADAQTTTEVVETKLQQETTTNIDQIKFKQNEMRDVVVMVLTKGGSGSGVIINRIATEDKNIYEYIVLTNAHVVNPRLISRLRGVNGITGKLDIHVVDTGCNIIYFDYQNRRMNKKITKVISEDIPRDLAMLSFRSKTILPIAKIASDAMLSQVRVFDDIFAVGCQLRTAPSPTDGIISQILIGKDVEKKLVIYWMTSQITRGSSGGGLFKEYNGHYYLIGIPYMVSLNKTGQVIPHLSRAISIVAARKFINLNSSITP